MKKFDAVFISILTIPFIVAWIISMVPGCIDDVPQPRVKFLSDRMSEIEYSKDSRTGICFASYKLGYSWGSLTAVPCTPEVEGLIK